MQLPAPTGRNSLGGIPWSVQRARCFTWAEKLALIVLWGRAGADGRCFTALSELAADMPANLKSARSAINGLVEKGCIRLEGLAARRTYVVDAAAVIAFVEQNDGRDEVATQINRREPSPYVRARNAWNHIRARVSPAIFKRDNFACRECGIKNDLTVDHIIALVDGGTNDDANLQTLCRACNTRKFNTGRSSKHAGTAMPKTASIRTSHAENGIPDHAEKDMLSMPKTASKGIPIGIPVITTPVPPSEAAAEGVQAMVSVLLPQPGFETDPKFLAKVATKYGHLDLEEEAIKMVAWLKTPAAKKKKRTCTPAFVLNWLSGATDSSPPANTNGHHQGRETPQRERLQQQQDDPFAVFGRRSSPPA